MRIRNLVGAFVAGVAAASSPGVALAAHAGIDDPADGQATVSGQPSAPDVSRVDIDYDRAGSISLTVRFYAPLDTIDTSQNYAFYANFAVGHAKRGFQS